MNKLQCGAACVALALASSCMVGPKYAKPPLATTPTFKESPPPAFKETNEWRLAHPEDTVIRGKWWELFNDSALNALEEQVVPNNLDLKQAEARFREARTAIRYNRAAKFPTISVGPSISSLKNSAHRPYVLAAPTPTGDFVLPVDATYEVDMWGRIRRSITAAQEEAQASAADLATIALSLHSDLAIDYFNLKALDRQTAILTDTVKAYEDALRLTNNRYEGGAAAKQEVVQAQTQLDGTRAQLTDVGVLRAEYEHAIAILLGKPPALFSLSASPLNVEPPVIPVALPSQLLERRPDIAAAERRVAEANEQIGIAKAAFYPTISLGGSVGLEGNQISNWFNWPSRFWGAGPSATQVLFDAGRRRSVSDRAMAAYDATVAGYQKTALTAFQEVEDNLAALRILQQEAQQQRQAVLSSQNLVDLSMNRYKGGVDTYLQVITSQTTNLTNQRLEVDVQVRRMEASVRLIKALGGGWTLANLPAISQLQ